MSELGLVHREVLLLYSSSLNKADKRKLFISCKSNSGVLCFSYFILVNKYNFFICQVWRVIKEYEQKWEER